MRFLLLQARNAGDPAQPEELASFAARAGLPPSAFSAHDLLHGPPTLAQVRQFDALMIGGSGDYNVSARNLPHFQKTLDLLADVVAAGHPTFASCFGFQLMAASLGGAVNHDPASMEVGTYDLFLTPAAQTDELFSVLSPTSAAQLGHKERITLLPEGVVNLAWSELCPYQAFRVPDKPIWAMQFHPELSGPDNLQRFQRYAKMYAGVLSPAHYAAALARFGESPETERLIPRFIELICS